MASAGIRMQSSSTQKKIHISVLLQTNTEAKPKTNANASASSWGAEENPPGRNNIFMTMYGKGSSRIPIPIPLSLSKADNWQCPKGFLLFPFQCSQFFHPFRFFFLCEVVRETGALASRRSWELGNGIGYSSGRRSRTGSGSRWTLSGDISLHISMFSLAKLDLCFCCSPRICIFNVHLCLCVKMPHGAQKGNPSRSKSHLNPTHFPRPILSWTRIPLIGKPKPNRTGGRLRSLSL